MKCYTETKKSNVGDVCLITLENTDGMKVILSSYGAAIYQIYVKNDHESTLVTMGPSDLDLFNTSVQYYGKTIGRTSGRVLTKPFLLNNKEVTVTPFGDTRSQLHGGESGFGLRHFDVIETKALDDLAYVKFKLISKDGEAGYPGNLETVITYTLNMTNQLTVTFDATSDQDTLCNLTNHTYFNLSGQKENIDQHIISIDADAFVEVDDTYHALRLKSVEKTPYDLRNPQSFSTILHDLKETPFGGIDHTFKLNHPEMNHPSLVVYHPISNIGLRISTDYPALVLYTHNHYCKDVKDITLDDGHHSSIAIECQYEPGGIHYPFLHDAILKKDDTYHHVITYQFYRHQ
ncbi:MAG: aldose epimerase family protein [Acholeplasmataceae bacterium]